MSTPPQTPYRRNLLYFVVVESIWAAGTTFSNEVNILPVYLAGLGASGLVLGILPAAIESMRGLQVFSAYLIGNRAETRRWVWIMHVAGCMLWLPLGVLSLLQPTLGLSNNVLIAGFFVMYASILSFWFVGGAGYMGLMGRSLHPARRQIGLGLALLTGKTLALAASAGSTAWQGSGLPMNVRFGVAFMVTGVLTTLSVLPVLVVRESPRQPPPQRPNLSQFIKQGWHDLLHHRPLRAYLLSLVLLSPSVLLVYSYVVQSGADAAKASILMAFFLVGQAGGNLVCGWVGDRWGAKTSAAMASLALVVGLLVMLTEPRGPALWGVAVSVGVFVSGSIVSRFGMLTAFSPDHDATHYTGVTGLVLAPFAVAAALGGSYLVDRVGYHTVLLATLACVLASVVVLVWRVGPSPTPAPSDTPTH